MSQDDKEDVLIALLTTFIVGLVALMVPPGHRRTNVTARICSSLAKQRASSQSQVTEINPTHDPSRR